MKKAIMTTKTTKNVGDVFQCLATKQFMQEEIQYIDREFLNLYQGEDIKIILNGWYIHDSTHWPPNARVHPLLTSIHISNGKQSNGQIPMKEMILSDKVKYLSDKSIGCRDLYTYQYLKKKNINCYFSGCMTLTLNKDQQMKKTPKEYICITDCSDALYTYLQSQTNREIRRIVQEGEEWLMPYENRLLAAKELLEVYHNAHLVISPRLHVILPCLAMQTPVLRIESKYGDERYEGIGDLMYSCLESEIMSGRFPLDIENPIKNPDYYLTIRNNLILISKMFLTDQTIPDTMIKQIHRENIEALIKAKNHQISFRKQHKLRSYFIRQKLYQFRTFIRNKKHHL